MWFWFFAVVVIYLIFIGVLFYLRGSFRDRIGKSEKDNKHKFLTPDQVDQLISSQTISGKMTPVVLTEKNKVAEGARIEEKDISPIKDVQEIKEIKSRDFRLTIDPRNFLQPFVLEHDDDGGIVIRCAADTLVYSSPIEESVPIKSEDEMNMDYLADISELSESMQEWK